MNIEELRDFALSLPDVEEDCPFGPTVVVFRIRQKIFMLLPLDTEGAQCNLKCNPELAIEYRERFPHAVLPGYHMNKKHWNTVVVHPEITDSFIKEQIQNSYDLVKGKKK